MEGVRAAVLEFNDVHPVEQPWHRRRLRLMLGTPALKAHSTLRHAAWRQVVADYVALRLGMAPDSLLPQTVGHASLGVVLAAYERWLDEDGGELRELLDTVYRALEHGLTAPALRGG